MMILIFTLFFSCPGQATEFNPDHLSRQIQTSLLDELQTGGKPSKYLKIDSLLQTLSSLRTSCQIELRDHRDPAYCFELVHWAEKVLNRPAKTEQEELTKLRKDAQKKAALAEYIKSRKKASAGTVSE